MKALQCFQMVGTVYPATVLDPRRLEASGLLQFLCFVWFCWTWDLLIHSAVSWCDHLTCWDRLFIWLKCLLQGEHLDDEESFFDLLSRFQSKRMDDQRCSLTVTENKENTNLVPKSNHNNNAAASIKPMMPLNNSNAANSKTTNNGKKLQTSQCSW